MRDVFRNKYFSRYLPLYIIILALVVLLGSSYALLRSSHTSTNAYTMNVGLLEVDFYGTTNTLTYNNMYPMTDEEGLSLNDNVLNFTIKNTGQIKASYDIYIEETSTNPEFKSVIKYAVNKDDAGYGKTKELENNMLYIDKNQTIKANGTVNYKVKFWLDYNADATYMNKTFTAKVVITSRQWKEDMSAQELITNIKTNNLKEEGGIPLNYITETDNNQTITYLSGCSKYYLDQNAEGCTQDNTIDFNYVWYSGRMWRITSFNETTNTIKLITEQPQTAIAWHDSNTTFEGSYMKQFLNDEFYDSLYNPTDFIDTSIQWNATQVSSVSTKPASTTMVTSNVGLLNSYEYYQSYQKVGSSNKYDFGYLNIGQFGWLLNPYSALGVWAVNRYGSANGYSPTYATAGRPSINLKSTVNFKGSGTETDPYRLVGDKEVGTPNNKLNTRTIGEYVKLKSGANEQVFRIVGFEGTQGSESTKLIQLDYVKENGTNVTKTFATSNSSGDGTIFGEGNTIGDSSNQTWYYYLTNTYINNLKTKYDIDENNSMFVAGNYYLGINAENPSDTQANYNYRTSICATTSDLSKNCTKSSSKSLKAGLLRYGEMFASQHGIGYNTKTSTYNTSDMWLMTRKTASGVWSVYGSGYAGGSSPTDTSAGRPSINLSSSVEIKACDTELCDGTPSHPYVVGM